MGLSDNRNKSIIQQMYCMKEVNNMYLSDHNVLSHSWRIRYGAAFTLIEIMVIVVILSIAALIAIPVFSGAGEMQLRAAADKLAADMEYAKSLAVTTQRNHKVIFNTNTESYEIRDASNNLVTDPVKKGSFIVTYPSEGRLNKVGVRQVDFNGTATVQFNYTGAPLDANGNALTSAHSTVVIEAGNHQITIKVEPVTGYISIQ